MINNLYVWGIDSDYVFLYYKVGDKYYQTFLGGDLIEFMGHTDKDEMLPIPLFDFDPGGSELIAAVFFPKNIYDDYLLMIYQEDSDGNLIELTPRPENASTLSNFNTFNVPDLAQSYHYDDSRSTLEILPLKSISSDVESHLMLCKVFEIEGEELLDVIQSLEYDI